MHRLLVFSFLLFLYNPVESKEIIKKHPSSPQIPHMFLFQDQQLSIPVPAGGFSFIKFNPDTVTQFGDIFTVNPNDPTEIIIKETGNYTFRFIGSTISSVGFANRLSFYLNNIDTQFFTTTEPFGNSSSPENLNLRFTTKITQANTTIRVGIKNIGTSNSTIAFAANTPCLQLMKLSSLNVNSSEPAIPHLFVTNPIGQSINFLTTSGTQFVNFMPDTFFDSSVMEMGDSPDEIILKKPGRYLCQFDSVFFTSSNEVNVQFFLNGKEINSSTTKENFPPSKYTFDNIITVDKCNKNAILKVGLTAKLPNRTRLGFFPNTVGMNILYLPNREIPNMCAYARQGEVFNYQNITIGPLIKHVKFDSADIGNEKYFAFDENSGEIILKKAGHYYIQFDTVFFNAQGFATTPLVLYYINDIPFSPLTEMEQFSPETFTLQNTIPIKQENSHLKVVIIPPSNNFRFQLCPHTPSITILYLSPN